MKKLLIVLLTVALTLSLVAVASAATVNSYMGGRFYFEYKSINKDNLIEENLAPWDANDSMITMNWNVKAESGNSWVKLQWLNEVWANPESDNPDMNIADGGPTNYLGYPYASARNAYLTNFTYAIGMNNIGDIFSWQYNTGAAITTIGFQSALNTGGNNGAPGGIDSPGQYDPMWFNRPKDVLALGIKTDSFKLNVEYSLNKQQVGNAHYWAGTWRVEKQNLYVATAIFSFDNGDVHAGYSGPTDIVSNNSYIVGAKFKFEGLGTLAADYYSKNDWDMYTQTARDYRDSTFQANMGFDNLKMNATLAYFMPNSSNSDKNYIGLGYSYTGIDKVSLNVKYFTADNATKKAAYDVFATYNVGAFGVRAGYACTNPDDSTNGSFVYVGAFGSIW